MSARFEAITGRYMHLDLFGLHFGLGAFPGGVGGILLGIAVCLAIGALAGFINGCVVVYGRIQPIIATLATGAVYIGIALFLRPTPGGKIDEDLNWALTNSLGDFASTVHIFDDGSAASPDSPGSSGSSVRTDLPTPEIPSSCTDSGSQNSAPPACPSPSCSRTARKT